MQNEDHQSEHRASAHRYRTGRNEWYRATKRRPCPLCGRKKWCLIAKNGSAVICPGNSDGATRYLGGVNYLHCGNFDVGGPQ